MEHSHNHHYKNGAYGRSLQFDMRTSVRTARMTCSECDTTGSVRLVSLLPPEVIDKKFVQKGWELDPNVCPNCVGKKVKAKKEQKMATAKPNGALAEDPVLKAVSANTHKAQAKMHQLLCTYFDEEEGTFSPGWNDERIAKESGMALTHVIDVREQGYGPLKEPEEVTKLKSDIKALNDLVVESLTNAQKEVNALNARVTELTKKLGFK